MSQYGIDDFLAIDTVSNDPLHDHFFVLLSFLSHLWFYKCLFPIHNFFHGYRKWMSQNGWRTDRSIIYSCSENHLRYIYPNPIKYCLSGRIIKVLDWFWCKKNFEFWKGKKTANLASFTEPWNRKNWMNGIHRQKIKNTKN